MKNNAWFENNRTLWIGHRGAPCLAFENTIEAFSLAVSHNADGVELDVHLTADGIPFIFHDDFFANAGWRIPVTRFRFADIREIELSAGNKHYRIPGLADVLALLQPTRLLVNVELKSTINPQEAQRIVDCVEHAGMKNRVLFSSFSLDLIQAVQPCGCAVAYLYDRNSACRPGPNGDCIPPGLDALNPHHALVDDDFLAWARQFGYPVITWTVNDADERERLVKAGICGVITDRMPHSEATERIPLAHVMLEPI